MIDPLYGLNLKDGDVVFVDTEVFDLEALANMPRRENVPDVTFLAVQANGRPVRECVAKGINPDQLMDYVETEEEAKGLANHINTILAQG